MMLLSRTGLYIQLLRNVILGVVEFMPVLSSTKVSRGYRTTVLREVRRLLELGENNTLEWVFENGRVCVRKAQR